MKKRSKTDLIYRTQYQCTGLQVREDEEGKPSRTIAGYAILFNTPSAPLWEDSEESAREVISSGAITRELLDASDIKFTMFHDRQLILARSNKGQGTLSYDVDERGVKFEFEAPATMDGDKALELVRRGDISGCSFAFTTRYYDKDFVERSVNISQEGKKEITYVVRNVTGIYDFTLAADPAYPDTSVEAREFSSELREAYRQTDPELPIDREKINRQVHEMRKAANDKII